MTYDHHIALMGKEAAPILIGYSATPSKHVTIVHSSDYATLFERVKVRLIAMGAETVVSHVVRPHSVANCQDKSEVLYNTLRESRVVCNYTGGTKLMSIWYFLRGFQHKRTTLLYLSTENRTLEWSGTHPEVKPDFPILDLSVKEWFELGGHPILNAVDADFNSGIMNLIEEWQTVRQTHYQLYSTYRKESDPEYRYLNYKRIGSISFFKDDDGDLLIESRSGIFKKQVNDWNRFFFEGFWFEMLAYMALRSSHYFDEVLLNLVTTGQAKKGESIPKNEIDIVCRKGETVVLIDCKTGSFGQNDVDKLAANRRRYGTPYTRCVILSDTPKKITGLLEQSMKELGVNHYVADSRLPESIRDIVLNSLKES